MNLNKFQKAMVEADKKSLEKEQAYITFMEERQQELIDLCNEADIMMDGRRKHNKKELV